MESEDVTQNNKVTENKPEEKELKFVSFQTHFVDKSSSIYFREKYMTVIYGTTVDGHLYEKVILAGWPSNWIRIDNVKSTPRPKYC